MQNQEASNLVSNSKRPQSIADWNDLVSQVVKVELGDNSDFEIRLKMLRDRRIHNWPINGHREAYFKTKYKTT